MKGVTYLLQRAVLRPYWKKDLHRSFKNHWQLYLLLVVPVTLTLIFNYLPMVGILMSFEDYHPLKGIFGSKWVGFYHFERFFNSPVFFQLLKNTLSISIYNTIVSFIVPLVLALSLFELRSLRLRKTVQLVTYAPFFISTVVLVGMVFQCLNPRYGIVNSILKLCGFDAINFMGEPWMYQSIYVWSGIWQGAGYGAVIYLAALSAVDPQLYESAVIDGANKVQRMWHVDLPGIMPTLVIQMIFLIGSLFSVGYEKIYLLQNSLNIEISEVISTYVYSVGILNTRGVVSQYGFAAAVGLFNSVVNFFLVIFANSMARKFNDTSIW